MAVNVGQRNVPDTPQNQQLQACTKAKELALHTLAICKNKNVFTEDYKNILTDDIATTAKDIFIYAFYANDIRVADSKARWTERCRYQEIAIAKCKKLKPLISLAKSAFHLRGKKVDCWIRMLFETKTLLENWHMKDVKRYSNCK